MSDQLGSFVTHIAILSAILCCMAFVIKWHFAKLSPNFSFSWAELVFILNFSHHPPTTHPPRIVVKVPNTTQFSRAKCIRTHHNLSNNKFDMIYIYPTNEFHPSDESQQYHDLEFSTWLRLSTLTYLEFLYSLRDQSQQWIFIFMWIFILNFHHSGW